MRLGIRPAAFLLRLLVAFACTYALWALLPVASLYTQMLAVLAHAAVRFTEWFGPATLRGGTTVFARGEGVFYTHRLLPPNAQPPGIPGDWVQANLVLLIPLMIATPAPNWRIRCRRLGIALLCALALQVIGLVVTIKATWVSTFGPTYFSDTQHFIYGFLDAFFQSFDTQLFPFAIWAGIHFNQLLGRTPAAPVVVAAGKVRAAAPNRRQRKAARKAGSGR